MAGLYPTLARSTLRHSTILVALALVALFGSPADALHQDTPGVVTFTKDASHAHPTGRSWGFFFSFSSTQDLANTGSTSRQIFLFKQLFYDCQKTPQLQPATVPLCPNPPQPYLVQVTNRPGSPDNPSASDKAEDGTQWVAFDGDGILDGDTGDVGSHRQIYLKNLLTQELKQITAAGDGDSVKPTVSSEAGVVVFESTAALTGPNPAHVSQLFLYDRRIRFLKQLTAGAVPSTGAMTNQNGTSTIFQSAADLLGDGHDTGISQIFLATYNKSTQAVDVRQLTTGNGPSEHPYIITNSSPSGNTVPIAFASSATDLPGTSTGSGKQIYLLDDANEDPLVFRRLTDSTTFGDCDYPGIVSAGDRVEFICTGDPLRNGTTGNRVFILDLRDTTLFQINGTGDVQGPIGSHVGEWFVTMSTTADLDGTGDCGYQLKLVDFFPGHYDAATAVGQLPPDVVATPGKPRSNLIGRRSFVVAPGNASGGSKTTATTRDSSASAPLTGAAGVELVIGAPDEFSRQASIRVPQTAVSLPPVRILDLGTLCITAAEDGSGVLDCDGEDAGGDFSVKRDHNSDDNNPLCIGGCREGDTECEGTGLPGPHQNPCPACLDGACTSGLNEGQPCSNKSSCLPSDQCVNGTLGVCNGPMRGDPAGTFAAGGMQVTLPVTISISTQAAVGAPVCGPNDTYAVKNIPATLFLTSGTVTAKIDDADDRPGATLTATSSGEPFSCGGLQAGAFGNGHLVAALPLLDIPQNAGLRDVILGLDLFPKPDESACHPPCAEDADCDDGNACNGHETCRNSFCVEGTPDCNDGDPCNGVETCDPATGCHQGTPPSCDDGARCTTDVCTADEGCTHASIHGCCTSDADCRDNDVCNGDERCVDGDCVAGAPLVCDDGKACNGVETCDPVQGCKPGVPPACATNTRCMADTCDDAIGCIHTPIPRCCDADTDCDDHNACDGVERCVGGTCVPGTALQCDDGKACNGVEICDAQKGCIPGTPLKCADNVRCTADTCDDIDGCLHTPMANCCTNNNDCNDNNLCNGKETCVSGTCVPGTPLQCDDGNICNGVETCDPALGCRRGVPLDCNDHVRCTADSCDPTSGCEHSPLPGCCATDADCDDHNACNGTEHCSRGECFSSAPLFCDDGDACNGAELCDPARGCVPGIAPVRFSYEGITCELTAIGNALSSAPAQGLGGRGRVTQLTRILAKVRRNLGAGGPSAGLAGHLKTRAAEKGLRKFARMLEGGMRKGTTDPTVAGPIRDMVGELLTRVSNFRVGAR